MQTHPGYRWIALLALICCGLSTAARAQDDEPGAEPPKDLKDMIASGKKPKAISQAAPEYPPDMARAGLIGSVDIQFIINTNGGVDNPYVVRSNNPWFERPAIEAILKWRFSPGEMNGKPVKVRAAQRIEFQMFPGGRPAGLWGVEKGSNHKKLPPELQWDKPPVPVNTRFPVYPFEQLQAGTSGKASISYLIGPDGRVVEASLREATVPEFGEAVLGMIDAWKFTPPTKKDGTPCYAMVGCEYEFKPSGDGDVPVSGEARDILKALARKPESIATMKELDKPLNPRSRRPPTYPTMLKKSGQDGTATIEFWVDKNGDAQLPRVSSCTAKEFGYAAAQAVATWRFDVPRRGGKPVVVRTQIPVEFSLREPKPATPK